MVTEHFFGNLSDKSLGSSDDDQSDDAAATATALREELSGVDEVLMLPQTQSSHDRTEHGGGVAIWIKSNIPFRHLDGIPCQGFEVIWLSIVLSSGERAVLCSVYRPGSCSGTDIDLIRYIDQTIPAIRRFGSKLILAATLMCTARLGSTALRLPMQVR